MIGLFKCSIEKLLKNVEIEIIDYEISNKRLKLLLFYQI